MYKEIDNIFKTFIKTLTNNNINSLLEYIDNIHLSKKLIDELCNYEIQKRDKDDKLRKMLDTVILNEPYMVDSNGVKYRLIDKEIFAKTTLKYIILNKYINGGI